MSTCITHMNAEIEKLFFDTQFRLDILKSIKDTRAPKSSSDCYFYYHLKTLNGEMLYRVLKQMKDVSKFDLEYELAPLKFKTENENIYSVNDGHEYRVVSQPKDVDFLVNETKTYLSKRWQAILRGDRYNCDTSLSESLPYLYTNKYYNYVSNKIHAKSKPRGAGDGVLINRENNTIEEEVEVKYTASGGCRQTFSPKQLDKAFIITSISRKNLNEVTKQLSQARSASVPIDFYSCKDKFVEALEGEVRAKNKRGGTGRYEISNMIEKIESSMLYCDKQTIVVEL